MFRSLLQQDQPTTRSVIFAVAQKLLQSPQAHTRSESDFVDMLRELLTTLPLPDVLNAIAMCAPATHPGEILDDVQFELRCQFRDKIPELMRLVETGIPITDSVSSLLTCFSRLERLRSHLENAAFANGSSAE